MLPIRSVHACALVVALTTLASGQDRVWVVAGDGSGDFLEVADAVQAAHQRDLILIRSGTYTAQVVISNKALSLVADDAAVVILDSPFEVRDLAPMRDVYLHGLEFASGFSAVGNAGTVQFDSCYAAASGTANPPLVPPPQHPDCGVGVSTQQVSDSVWVTFTNCTFVGRPGTSEMFGWPGEHGLLIEGSNIACYDCAMTGGAGGSQTWGLGGTFGGAGGDGIQLNHGSTAHLVRDSSHGGLGGSSPFIQGCDGETVRADPSSSFEYAVHPSIGLECPPLVRSGSPATLTALGPVGAGVFLLRAELPSWRVLGEHVGILHLRPPIQIAPMGVVSASGDLSLQLGFSVAGPQSYTGARFQVFAVHAGQRFLSQPRTLRAVHSSL